MSDLAHKTAASLWALMLDHAMPAPTAIESLQALAGGRAGAVEALLTAAIRDGANTRPSVERRGGTPRVLVRFGSFADGEAMTIAGAMLLRQFDEAEQKRTALAYRLVVVEVAGDTEFAGAWLSWCARTKRAIEICRELVAAAQPEADAV